jgi:phosphopantetheinyl transferase
MDCDRKGSFMALSRETGTLSLCRIHETKPWEGYLTQSEWDEYAKIGSPVRRKEWLSVRVALKKAVLDRCMVHSPHECQIQKDRWGRPFVVILAGGRLRWLKCSISHKRGVASAFLVVVPQVNVGIDLEIMSERPLRLRRAFSSSSDALPPGSDPIRTCTVLWACKEAASKAMGVGLLKDFRSISIECREANAFQVNCDNSQPMQGVYLWVGDFVLAIVMDQRVDQSWIEPFKKIGMR